MTALLIPPYVSPAHVEQPEVVVTCPHGFTATQSPALLLCAGLSDAGGIVGVLEVYACLTCTGEIRVGGWDIDLDRPEGERIALRGEVRFSVDSVTAAAQEIVTPHRRWWHR